MYVICFTLSVGKVKTPKKNKRPRTPSSRKNDAAAPLHLLSYLPFKLGPRTLTQLNNSAAALSTEKEEGREGKILAAPGRENTLFLRSKRPLQKDVWPFQESPNAEGEPSLF